MSNRAPGKANLPLTTVTEASALRAPPAATQNMLLKRQRFRINSLRSKLQFPKRSFQVSRLPKDLKRVYGHLEQRHGEEYALRVVFTIRTAVELHRAWHLSLLTAHVLDQLKETFGLRMTWNLGVLRLVFRVEDGDYELQRRVPYDYDSEYATTALALECRRCRHAYQYTLPYFFGVGANSSHMLPFVL